MTQPPSMPRTTTVDAAERSAGPVIGDPQPDAGGAASRRPQPPRAVFLLAALVAVDAVFMALFLILEIPREEPGRFSLDRDHTYPEWYQYAKTLAVCVALSLLALRMRAVVLGAWAAAFLYALLDDSLQFHERSASWSEAIFGPGTVLGLISHENLGELLYVVGVCVVGAAVLGYAHLRADDSARRVSAALFVLASAFALASVGADILIAGLSGPRGSFSYAVLLLLDDGGELLVMSTVLAFACAKLAAPVLRPVPRGSG